jgi:CBS domain-containing protein
VRRHQVKTIRVADVYKLQGTASATVPETMPLEQVISRFAHEPALRAVFLVDSGRRFRGQITRASLMKWAHFHLFGGKGRRDVFVSELFRIVDGREGKDLLRGHEGGLAVRESDTLQTALEKMLDYQEDILPVLDSRDRVVGDLRLSEVLLEAIQEGKQRPA